MIENFKDVGETFRNRFAESLLGKQLKSMDIDYIDIYEDGSLEAYVSEYYNSYEERLGYTPKEDSHLGAWEGKRGESKFVPNSETLEGIAALAKLNEKGLNGIEYKNAEPDFSKCAEATVYVDDMTQYRDDYIGMDGTKKFGNFAQADIRCAEKWNAEAKEGKNDWTPRDVYNWRHENRCSWHERCDTITMDLVPFEVHSHFKHLGGVSECKVRDAVAGGEFDE